MKKKNKTGGITIPDFKLYYKTNQNSMVLAQKQTHRSTEQNREPRNGPIRCQLIFDKARKNIQWKKDRLFNKCVGKTGQSHPEE